MTKILDWNIDEIILRIDPRTSKPRCTVRKNTKRRYDISYSDIKKAYETIALIVLEYGEDYLPIFERLQKELDDHRNKQKLVDKAKEIAMQIKDNRMHKNR